MEKNNLAGMYSSVGNPNNQDNQQIIEQLSEKVRNQALRLCELQSYKADCERLILSFDPNQSIPVSSSNFDNLNKSKRNKVNTVSSGENDALRLENTNLKKRLSYVEADFQKISEKFNQLQQLYNTMKTTSFETSSKMIYKGGQSTFLQDFPPPESIPTDKLIGMYSKLYNSIGVHLKESEKLQSQLKEEIILNEEQKTFIEILKQCIESSIMKYGLATILENNKNKYYSSGASAIEVLIDLAYLQDECEKLRKENAEYLADRNGILNQVQLKENQVQDLTASLNNNQAEYTGLLEHLNECKEDLINAQKEVDRLDGELNEKINELNNLQLKSEESKNEIEIQKAKVEAELKLKNQNLTETMKVLQDTEQASLREQEHLKSAIKKDQNEANNTIKLVSKNFESEIEKLTRTIQIYKEDVDQLNQNNESLKLTIGNYQRLATDYEIKIAEVTRERDNMSACKKISVEENKNLIEELNKAKYHFRDKLSNEQSQIEELIQEIQIHKAELNDYKSMYYNMSSAKESMFHKTISLNQEINSLNNKNFELINLNSTLQSTLEKYRQEIRNLEIQLQMESRDNYVGLSNQKVTAQSSSNLNQNQLKNSIYDIKMSISSCLALTHKVQQSLIAGENQRSRDKSFNSEKLQNLEEWIKLLETELERCSNQIQTGPEKGSDDVNCKDYNKQYTKHNESSDNLLDLVVILKKDNKTLNQEIKRLINENRCLIQRCEEVSLGASSLNYNIEDIEILLKQKDLLEDLLKKALSYDKELLQIMYDTMKLAEDITIDEHNRLKLESEKSNIEKELRDQQHSSISRERLKQICRAISSVESSIKINSEQFVNYNHLFEKLLKKRFI